MTKLCVLITAWNEPLTLQRSLTLILNPNYLEQISIILIAPDQETQEILKAYAAQINFKNYLIITDEQKGKPNALNLGLSHINAKWTVFTDGDVIWEEATLPSIFHFINENPTIAGFTGRPYCLDPRSTFWGYTGYLLAENAHHKRQSLWKKGEYYYFSGYLYCIKSEFLPKQYPQQCLVDDAWITLYLISLQKSIKYCENAKVGVFYPKTFGDFLKQKRRSVGGYQLLAKYYPNIKFEKRTIFEEIKAIAFTLKLIKSPKEYLFFTKFCILRFVLWVLIFWDKINQKHSDLNLWKRIESSKN